MPEIRHMIQISASPDVIYPLISTAKGMAQWWAEDASELDGKIELAFFNRNTIYRLKPEVLESPRRAEWTCETGAEWEGTRLVFSIEPAKNGSTLRFTHAGWKADTDYYVSCTTAWGELIFRLKSAAEGKGRGPLFLKGSLAY
jgi:uncharacterized protein YndB with AHSA1/START domain